MRNLTPDMASGLSDKNVSLVVMAELFFQSATLRMWTGLGTLNWRDEDYFGGGNFIGISPIEETQDSVAKGLVASLSGIPSTLISLALTERFRGRPFRLYLAIVDSRSYVATEDAPGRVELEDGTGFVLLENNFVNSPYRIFSGLMDTMEFTDNGSTADIRLSVENILITGQRTKLSRYTQEDQRKTYPSDKGFDLINQLQDKELVW